MMVVIQKEISVANKHTYIGMRPITFNTHLFNKQETGQPEKAMSVPMFTCVAQFNSMHADSHMLVALGKDNGEIEG